RRAEAVMLALIKRKVDPARMIAIGYGEEQPIEDNSTAAGRAANRRPELTIVERGVARSLWASTPSFSTGPSAGRGAGVLRSAPRPLRTDSPRSRRIPWASCDRRRIT